MNGLVLTTLFSSLTCEKAGIHLPIMIWGFFVNNHQKKTIVLLQNVKNIKSSKIPLLFNTQSSIIIMDKFLALFCHTYDKRRIYHGIKEILG